VRENLVDDGQMVLVYKTQNALFRATNLISETRQ